MNWKNQRWGSEGKIMKVRQWLAISDKIDDIIMGVSDWDRAKDKISEEKEIRGAERQDYLEIPIVAKSPRIKTEVMGENDSGLWNKDFLCDQFLSIQRMTTKVVKAKRLGVLTKIQPNTLWLEVLHLSYSSEGCRLVLPLLLELKANLSEATTWQASQSESCLPAGQDQLANILREYWGVPGQNYSHHRPNFASGNWALVARKDQYPLNSTPQMLTWQKRSPLLT